MRTNLTGGITSFVVFFVMLALIVENIGAILFVGIIVLIVAFGVIALKNSMTDNIVEDGDANSNEIMKTDIDNVLNSLTAKYGAPDRVIRPENCTLNGYIALFVAHKILCISDVEFPFADIASYKLIDNYFIKNGEICGDIKTRTNEGSLIGRALEGAFWGGDTGAIIGGVTASKKTSVDIHRDDDRLIHDYTLLVNLKGINREGIEMHLGNDWRLAAELEHLFDQIIKESNSSMP